MGKKRLFDEYGQGIESTLRSGRPYKKKGVEPKKGKSTKDIVKTKAVSVPIENEENRIRNALSTWFEQYIKDGNSAPKLVSQMQDFISKCEEYKLNFLVWLQEYPNNNSKAPEMIASTQSLLNMYNADLFESPIFRLSSTKPEDVEYYWIKQHDLYNTFDPYISDIKFYLETIRTNLINCRVNKFVLDETYKFFTQMKLIQMTMNNITKVSDNQWKTYVKTLKERYQSDFVDIERINLDNKLIQIVDVYVHYKTKQGYSHRKAIDVILSTTKDLPQNPYDVHAELHPFLAVKNELEGKKFELDRNKKFMEQMEFYNESLNKNFDTIKALDFKRLNQNIENLIGKIISLVNAQNSEKRVQVTKYALKNLNQSSKDDFKELKKIQNNALELLVFCAEKFRFIKKILVEEKTKLKKQKDYERYQKFEDVETELKKYDAELFKFRRLKKYYYPKFKRLENHYQILSRQQINQLKKDEKYEEHGKELEEEYQNYKDLDKDPLKYDVDPHQEINDEIIYPGQIIDPDELNKLDIEHREFLQKQLDLEQKIYEDILEEFEDRMDDGNGIKDNFEIEHEEEYAFLREQNLKVKKHIQQEKELLAKDMRDLERQKLLLLIFKIREIICP